MHRDSMIGAISLVDRALVPAGKLQALSFTGLLRESVSAVLGAVVIIVITKIRA
jgi:hypothetical protein